MKTTIVYVNDAAYALKILQPMLPSTSEATTVQPTNWVLMGCAPRVTNDIGKWVSTEAIKLWRQDWADGELGQIEELLKKSGGTVSMQLTTHKTSLIAQTEALTLQFEQVQVLDARRPMFGQDLEPVTTSQLQEKNGVLGALAAVTSAGLLVALD